MRFVLIAIYFFLSSAVICAQQTITASLLHDGQDRTHVLYVPESYDERQAVPLVLNFHGYTSNANQQMNYGDFRALADDHGFIVVHPQGTLFQGSTHFNVGGWTIGSTTDDVSYTEELIDFISTSYNIDSTRVYSTGMSNGGYMSFLLACQLSDRIAAIASVTGSMTTQTYAACNPSHPTPVMQIHGTADNLVLYHGTSWSRAIDDVLNYWIDYNKCNPDPEQSSIADLKTNDGSDVEEFIYKEGDNEVEIIHLRVNGGGHTWPDLDAQGLSTNQDIDASAVIWDFFDQYDINGLRDITSDVSKEFTAASFSIYPNPAQNKLTLETNLNGQAFFQIINIDGGVVSSGFTSTNDDIDLSQLSPSIYFLKVGGFTKKFVISR